MCPTRADSAHASEPTIAHMASLRAEIGHAIQPHQALAMLALGDQRSTLLISEGESGHAAPVVHHIQIGLELLAKRTFKERMPTAVRLEQAIMVVEDAVMPLARLLPHSHCLITQDALLGDIAATAMGAPSPAQDNNALPLLTREAVEHLFQSLVMQAEQPQHLRSDLRQSPRWAAGLVILREILHHWQTGQLRIYRPANPPLQVLRPG